MRRNRADFDLCLKLFEAQIEAFAAAVLRELQSKLDEAVTALARTLLPRIRDRVPQRYIPVLPTSQITDVGLLPILEQDIKEYFGSSTEVFKPELSCIFKDSTYKSIINNDFLEALGNALRKGGGKRLAEQMLSKHVAAPETN
jgi:hypothetical protein